MPSTNHLGGSAGRMRRPTRLPPFVLPLAALLFLLFGFGPNWVFAAGALLVLLAICALLWRPGETPILLFIFVYQWIEASITIFYANWLDQPIEAVSTWGVDVRFSTVLSLIALLIMSIGVRLAVGGPRRGEGELIQLQVQKLSQRQVLIFYVATLIISMGATTLADMLPGLSQPLLVLPGLKWAAYILLTYQAFSKSNADKKIWLIIFLFELIISIGGFFSSFKFVFIATFLGVAATSMKFTTKKLLAIGLLILISLLFGAIWSSIKMEYRAFVSSDGEIQTVSVDYRAQIQKLSELVSSMDIEKVREGAESLVLRIAYVEFFGAVTDYVPHIYPHTNGELWFDAISRPFMPRLFFENKSIIDESALTNRFTGLNVGGFEQGTQISIGYIGDTYIDFGEYAMMAYLMLVGCTLGWAYRWLLYGQFSRGALGSTQVAAILMSVSIGTSSAKLFGGLAVSLLVVWAFNRLVVPRFFPWLRVLPAK